MSRPKPSSSGIDPSGEKTAEPGVKAGQSGVLAAFLANQVSLRGFISRFMITAHEIDDVSQETFLRAYKAEMTTAVDQPKAYLFRTAKNLMLNEFGKKARKVTDYIEDVGSFDGLQDSESLEDNVMAQQRLGIYCEAMASLPEQCRRVMLMKKVYGLPTKEVARRLGISISTVEKHMTKGLKDCNAVLTERYSEVNTEPAPVDRPHRENSEQTITKDLRRRD